MTMDSSIIFPIKIEHLHYLSETDLEGIPFPKGLQMEMETALIGPETPPPVNNSKQEEKKGFWKFLHKETKLP